MAASEQPVIDEEVHKQDGNLNASTIDIQPSISEKKFSSETPGEPNDVPSLDTTLPRNWSTKKKLYNVAVPSLLCFVVYIFTSLEKLAHRRLPQSPTTNNTNRTFGTSIYTPAIPDVMRDFKVTETVATLPLTTYTLGLAFGPMISAPVSETLGRMGTYRICVPLCALFSLGAGYAPSIAALCILRFFAAFFGGAPLPVTAGTGADLFDERLIAMIGTFVMYSPFLGPAIGPVVGSFVSQHNGWHWTQYTLAIVAAAAYIPVLGLSETYLKIIMARREKKKSDATQEQKPPAKTLLFKVLFITLLRPIKMLISEPIVTFLSVYVAFNLAVVFMFFGSIPYVFESVYGFNRGETGLVFLAVGLGCTISVPTCIILDKLIYQKRWIRANREGSQGAVAPEHRLWAAMLGGFGLPIGLFWFAWSSRSDVHWIVPTLALIPYAWGNLCIFISVAMYLIDTYEALTAASAIAANGLLRFILAATFPLFTITMYRRLGIGWATSVLGFIALAMLPIPWTIYKWGKEIRKKSKFETRKFE